MELANWYSVAKAIHLIGMVSWMAGLFYLVRLMVYHAEAALRPQPEADILMRQFALMEWKVYRIILRPALVITWVFGSLLLVMQPAWLQQGWLYGKLTLVMLLTGYTWYCQIHIRRLENRTSEFSGIHFRIMNEVPTVILVGAVFLAVFKGGINWWYLAGGIGIFTALILTAVRRVARKK